MIEPLRARFVDFHIGNEKALILRRSVKFLSYIIDVRLEFFDPRKIAALIISDRRQIGVIKTRRLLDIPSLYACEHINRICEPSGRRRSVEARSFEFFLNICKRLSGISRRRFFGARDLFRRFRRENGVFRRQGDNARIIGCSGLSVAGVSEKIAFHHQRRQVIGA